MRSPDWRDSAACAVTAVALLGVAVIGQRAVDTEGVPRELRKLFKTLRNRDLNREAREELTGGYYEGLLNEGSRVSSMNRLLTGSRRIDWTGGSRPGRRVRNDFLYYETLPNLDIPDYEDERLRLVTNSLGLADREYPLERRPDVRRIAVLGDSLTRGQGAPFGTCFEALLEEELNARHVSGDTRQFEVINFAVSGYRITQTLEVALTKVPSFKPDVYLVALSDLSVFRKWGHHLAQLVYDGIDLKYPYLKQIAREAQLSRDDPFGTFDAKLARYRLPVIRWILSEIDAHVAREGAELVVLLVPTVTDPESLAEDFTGVPEILADLDVPTVDLLDTFAAQRDLTALRVSEQNRHPNERGHRVLFEQLLRKAQARPAIWGAIVGPAAGGRTKTSAGTTERAGA